VGVADTVARLLNASDPHSDQRVTHLQFHIRLLDLADKVATAVHQPAQRLLG